MVKKGINMKAPVLRFSKLEENVHNTQKKDKRAGLCTICNNVEACVYSKDPERPVWQCAEFDDSYQPPMSTKDTYRFKSIQKKVSPKEIDSSKYRGLCINCEKRENCKFPKPEWGVWHCEEYQ